MFKPTPLTEDELFHSQYAWFLGHVASLALEPEACCESQGNYNVAHELWFFIRSDELPRQPSDMLSSAQRAAVDDLCRCVAEIPEDARRWTTVGAESGENMRNAAWQPMREKARHLLEVLAPVTQRLSSKNGRDTRFTIVLFSLVAFIALCIVMLRMAPAEVASFIYILWTTLFTSPLKKILRGKSSEVRTRLSSAVAPLWLFTGMLLLASAGVAAFVVFWITRNHFTAINVFTGLTALALLLLVLAGARLAPNDP